MKQAVSQIARVITVLGLIFAAMGIIGMILTCATWARIISLAGLIGLVAGYFLMES